MKKKSIDYEKKLKKSSPTPGIEPGPTEWKAAMLTTTPPGISLYWRDKSKIDFMYIRADSALTHYVLRAWKTFNVASWVQTPIFETQMS